MNKGLEALHGEIAARTAATTAAHPAWLCRKGCDACCRRLAEPPRLTAPEWELLAGGIAGLPATVRQDVTARAGALPERGPMVCPLLDTTAGTCLVYQYRPVACRTYGFYVERGAGLYCTAIEAEVAAARLARVVWGNAAGVDARLAALGEALDLRKWLGKSP